MLTFYSASNGIVNSQKAIQNSLEVALADHETTKCSLLVIHATIGHDFKQILDQAGLICPNAKIVGCTCAGVIGREGSNENMRALAIMAVCTNNGEEISIAYCEEMIGQNSFEMAIEMSKDLYKQNSKINMIQILASGIDIAADQAITGIEEVFGQQIPIFGGTSSDNMKAIHSFQFHGTEVLKKGGILIGYADPTLEVIMGVHHGSVPVGESFSVTKSKANRVYEINNQPAWSFLMDQLELPHNTHPGPCIPIAGLAESIAPDLFEVYNNKHILRVIVKVEDDKSFYMPVDCKEGTELWLTRRDEELIFSGVEEMLSNLSEKIEGKQVVGVFHTDCAARGRALLDKINKEEIITKMQQAISIDRSVPWLGMYGYGEFTLLGNRNRFHNYTSSIYALIRRSS